MDNGNKTLLTRRRLLVGGATIVAASALPKVPARAGPPATYRRYNVASTQGQQMLGYYQVAIQAMLALPPSDPRNWYRLAFTHYLDCPHGNWWLFPWHRGFTGWAEQIVRQFSGFDHFAFPYWDWTASPQVPAAMSQGLLNPANPAFISNINAFTGAFQPALANSGYWQGAQLQQLQIRDIGSNAILWDQLTNPANSNWPSFFPAQGGGQSYPNVRNPNPALDCVAAKAVSAPVLASAMASQDYMTFSSPAAAHHSDVVGFAILEGQAHNNVHNNTGGIVHPFQNGQCGTSYTNSGGLMQAFLSPTDPLFYLHHSNIDRLWDAWTQAQIAAGSTTYLPPQGASYNQWAAEPFLFFCDAAGNPVAQNQAGNYASIGAFAYDYQPGSVGAQLNPSILARLRRLRVQRFFGVPPIPDPGPVEANVRDANVVRLEPALVRLTARGAPQRLIAKVTLVLPEHERGQQFTVTVDTGSGGAVEVGNVALFGHVMAHGPLTFTLPLDGAVATLRARNALRTNGALRFRALQPPNRAAAGRTGRTLAGAGREIRVTSVTIEAHYASASALSARIVRPFSPTSAKPPRTAICSGSPPGQAR